MSGGSYDYLYLHIDDLSNRRRDVEAMRVRLTQLGHRDIAAATRKVLDHLGRAEEAAEALVDVWHSVEWLDSNDWNEDQVTGAVQEYRVRLRRTPLPGS